jgi:hypothetical protein
LVSNCRVEGKRAHNCERCKKHSLSGKSYLHLMRIRLHLVIYFLPFRGKGAQKAAWRGLCRTNRHFGSAMITGGERSDWHRAQPCGEAAVGSRADS